MPKRGLLPVYVVVVVGCGGGNGNGNGEGVAVPVVASRRSLAVIVVVSVVSPQVCVTESAPSLMLSELPLTYFVCRTRVRNAARSRTRKRSHARTQPCARARARTHATESRYLYIHTHTHTRARTHILTRQLTVRPGGLLHGTRSSRRTSTRLGGALHDRCAHYRARHLCCHRSSKSRYKRDKCNVAYNGGGVI